MLSLDPMLRKGNMEKVGSKLQRFLTGLRDKSKGTIINTETKIGQHLDFGALMP